MPSCEATAERLPPHLSSVRRIICFSMSSRVDTGISGVSFLRCSWNNPADRNAPSQMITAFSMACSSSRILPYQGWSVSFSQAPSVSLTGGLSYCLQKRAMKSSARGMMSSGRSRNEGISRCIVLMRYSRSSRNSPFATISGRLRFVAQISRMSTGMGVLLPTRTIRGVAIRSVVWLAGDRVNCRFHRETVCCARLLRTCRHGRHGHR